MNTYQSIVCETDIGAATFPEGVVSLSVHASVFNRARVMRIQLNDPANTIAEAAVPWEATAFRWIFGKADPIRLFSGAIADAKAPLSHLVELLAFDKWNDVMTIKKTMTFAQQDPAEMLRSLVGDLEIPTTRIADTDIVLDRLPLFKNTVAEAVEILNKRTGLSRMSFIDEDGVFVWEDKDFEQDPAVTLQEGVDLYNLNLRDSLFTTWGRDLRLGTVVELVEVNETSHLALLTELEYTMPKGGSLITARYELAPEEVD